MVNIIGPGGAGINETTTRPPSPATASPDDTWFQDCSSPVANDGTKVSSRWLNLIIAQLRRAIRGMGVVEDETDDDMLLKAIQAAEAPPVTFHNLIAGEGLAGGGNMGADVTVNLHIPELSDLVAVDPAADTVAVYDASAQQHVKVKVSDLASASTYFNLSAGDGLAGGGNMGANIEIDLDIAELTAIGAADPNADFLALYDASANNHRKVLPKDLGLLQTYFTLTAGDGLSGGGNMGGNIAVALDINELTQLGAAAPATDFLALYDVSTGQHRKINPEDLGIGGGIVALSGNYGGSTSISVGSGHNGKRYGAFAVSQESTGTAPIKMGSGSGVVSGGSVTLGTAGAVGSNDSGRYVVIIEA